MSGEPTGELAAIWLVATRGALEQPNIALAKRTTATRRVKLRFIGLNGQPYNGSVDAAGDNYVTDKLSIRDALVPLASNDLLGTAG